ncbi:MAG: SGNH/GDSL hydrolase family protein [Solirubrobacterales bacterium]
MTARDPYAVIARALRSREAGERRERMRSYAALGDSFTAGTGCAPGRCWADRLAARLARRDAEFVYRNLAWEGAMSADVVEQLGPALQLEPDLVTVVFGANDVLRSVRPDVPRYARRLSGVFRRLGEAVPGARVVTATSPEAWHFLDLRPRTRARVERGIVALNRATREVAALHGVPLLDVARHPGLADAANFSSDGLHPSPLGHAHAAAGFERLLGIEPGARTAEREDHR